MKKTAMDTTQENLLKKVKDLEEAVETYRTMVDNSPDLLYRTDLEGRIIFVSPSVYHLSGYTVEEAVGMKMAEEVYAFPEERDAFLAELREKGRLSNFEARLKRKDGSKWWASTNAHFLKDATGQIIGVEGVTRDVSEIKLAQEALQESEERFRMAFETSPDSINLNRVADGMYLDINQGFTKLMGYTRADVIGKTSLELNIWKNPADRQRLIDGLMKNGYVQNLEAEFCKHDGSTGTGLMSARLLTLNEEKVILSVTREITERKHIEEQVQRVQKFESIGTLAGGIAHDFNNLLMGIQGRASLISTDLEPAHPHFEHIKAIEDYIRSATDLTRQLLGFARGGKYEVNPTDLNELVDKSVSMFGRMRKEIRIETKLKSPAPVAVVDCNQIEQVLLNLYVNAWQAMPDGGELYIGTGVTTLDEARCKPYQVQPGRYAQITVTDTGCGIDKANQRKIFDPFFTTKAKGRGTGLGLASAYGIIKNHDGIITVYSEIGHGTTFNIYLPFSNLEAAPAEATADKGLITGSETVLLVDDEKMILEVGTPMLEKMGYRVITADGGAQAVDLVEQQGAELDVVILDLIMPDMDGGKVFDRIHALRPQLPVLLSSGYSMNGQADKIIQRGCTGFIQKPFDIYELSRKIRKVLDKVCEEN